MLMGEAVGLMDRWDGRVSVFGHVHFTSTGIASFSFGHWKMKEKEQNKTWSSTPNVQVWPAVNKQAAPQSVDI